MMIFGRVLRLWNINNFVREGETSVFASKTILVWDCFPKCTWICYNTYLPCNWCVLAIQTYHTNHLEREFNVTSARRSWVGVHFFFINCFARKNTTKIWFIYFLISNDIFVKVLKSFSANQLYKTFGENLYIYSSIKVH